MPNSYKKARKIFEDNHGLLRTARAVSSGINQNTLSRMVRDGELVRISRGLYRLSDLLPMDNEDLVIVSSQYSNVVICLISALSFHGLTTQIPYQINISLLQGDQRPKINFPPIEVIWRSKKHYKSGIEEHIIENTIVKVYCIEKTIVDCFKFQKKVGKDVALEALKEYLQRDKVDIPKIIKFAKEIRIEKTIMPYLEMYF